jgi:hypothetical protein
MAFFTRTNVTPANGSSTSNVLSLNLSRINIQDAAIRQKLLGPSGIIQQSTQSELVEGPQGPQGLQGQQGTNAAAPLTNQYRSGTTAHFNLTYGVSDSFNEGRTTNVSFDAEGNVTITNPINQLISWGENVAGEESAFYEFSKSSSEVTSLDSMYFAIDVTGLTGTCQLYLSTFNNLGEYISDYSFGKTIRTDGRHTLHPYFPNIPVGQTWKFQLGIRAVSLDGAEAGAVTSGVTVTGVYIETDLKFGDNTYGVNFSVDGGDT